MNHWTLFRKDKFYLIKYLTAHLLFISSFLYIQYQLTNFDDFFSLEFSSWQILLLPFGLIIGVQIPVLIHNCVHRNLRPRMANFIVGELAGFYVLLSMASFELNHVMHHAHSDSDLDPHNPYKRGFIGFFFANNFGGTRVVLSKYLTYHGDNSYNRFLFKIIVVLHFLNVPLRLASWILLLGPSLFLVFFVPSYLFHMFVFSHINYVTHETKDDGSVHVYNLDSNPYYWFVNFFGSGVYYHKNHHANPAVYNPKTGASGSWLFR